MSEVVTFRSRSHSVPRQSRRNAQYRDLTMIYEGSSEAHTVHTPDLSTAGIFINTNLLYPEGAVLNLKFKLARSGYEIDVRGEVRYCLPGVGVGVEFVNISDEAKSMIEKDTD